VTRVKDACQTTTRWQRLDHHVVHFVVSNHASLLEIERIDRIIVAGFFVSVQVRGSATVPTVMEEQGVVLRGNKKKEVFSDYSRRGFEGVYDAQDVPLKKTLLSDERPGSTRLGNVPDTSHRIASKMFFRVGTWRIDMPGASRRITMSSSL
jgi:hypothetical protein